MILWRGKSRLDSTQEIAAVVTGLVRPSVNVKTGPMPQVWIVPIHAGRPAERQTAVCGDCPMIGACYVQPKTVASVIAAVLRGAYPEAHPFSGLRIRVGAWGDPAAVPLKVWMDLAKNNRLVGYTHQWRKLRAAPWRRLFMASVETVTGAQRAHRAGWRTYRVTLADDALPGEIECPNTTQGVQCIDCMLCDGHRRGGNVASVRVQAHGSVARLSAAWRVVGVEV